MWCITINSYGCKKNTTRCMMCNHWYHLMINSLYKYQIYQHVLVQADALIAQGDVFNCTS